MNKFIYALLCLFLNSGVISAQTDYYYYKGKKIPLTKNDNKVCVSISKDKKKTSERILANVSVHESIRDEAFDIFVISRSDFVKLASLDSWKEDAKSVVLTSSYYTEDKKEVYETPYLNVKLKKEEDANLLDSYAEKYRLRNLGSFSQYLPLWYILHVTPDSDKSPLECANELYESGYFASSVPDLAANSLLTSVRNISTVKTNSSIGVYNLHGQRINGLLKGLNIVDGKKIMVK